MRRTINERLSVLEEQVSEIRSNHLPHLQKDIDCIKNKIDRATWFLVTQLLGVVITLGILLIK